MAIDGPLLGAVKHCTAGLAAVDGAAAAAALQDLHRVAARVADALERERGRYYLGYEHPAMKRMVEADLDAGPAKTAWHDLGLALVELGAASRAAAGRTDVPEVARAQLARIGEWIDDTGRAVAAAARARSALPEPVEFSMNAAIGGLERETDPVSLRRAIDEIHQRFEDKQRAHERAAQVMTAVAEAVRDSGPDLPAANTAWPDTNGGRPRVGAGAE